MRLQGKDIDFRVSTVPTANGESVVLRILDKETVALDLASLGFSEDVRRDIAACIQRPNGINRWVSSTTFPPLAI